MRNHRTVIASPLKLGGPGSLIGFGSWRLYPHRLLVITDVLERCKTSGCLYRPLRSARAWRGRNDPKFRADEIICGVQLPFHVLHSCGIYGVFP